MAVLGTGACGDVATNGADGTNAAGDPAASVPTEVTAALDLPTTPYNYSRLDLPAHFQTDFVRSMDNTPATNPVSDNGATLGRVLFYDKHLSKSGTVACASCHVQAQGFSDNVPKSIGFAGEQTARNSMPISNARYYANGHFFWDERAATLEQQVLMPIQSSVEMGLTLDELVANVSAQPYYPYLFSRAFGSPEVTSDRISKALAQFVRSIVSYRSRFDQGLAAAGAIGPNFASFTQAENRGKALFLGQAGCARCHLVNQGPPQGGPPPNQAVFFVDRATNNGLTAGRDVDNGIGDLTSNPADLGRFKSPELRNVALSAPYMHDGRFASLTEVVNHYNTNVQPHPNLDPRLREPPPSTAPRVLNLPSSDVAALVAFLGTLTDQALVTDPKYADPFRKAAQ